MSHPARAIASTPRALTSGSAAFPLALCAFFASGFAALLYQVIWQRLLVLFSGVDVHSVTMIVASFMVGLGFGSLLGGIMADRLGSRANLWAFAAAESAIGLYGLASKTIYYDVLYTRLPHLAANPGTAAVVLMATLLLPTFCMGLSLPLLARALTRNIHAAGGIVGSLYGLNTLGAALGAFISTWLLLPRLGLERALWVGALLNFVCAGLAVLIVRIEGEGSPSELAEHMSPKQERKPAAPALERHLPFQFWATIFGFTGFLALALEIAWFRLLGVMLKSTSFTFGTLLGIYLAGLGIGAALAARRVGRSRHPGASFLGMQYAITIYVGISIIVLLALVGAGYPAGLVRHFGGSEPFDLASAFAIFAGDTPLAEGSIRRFLVFLFVYGLLPAALIGPPTILMGYSFPYLQKSSLESVGGLGRRVGILMASNITGATLGTMAAGWLLLPLLGTAGTLKLLVALGLVLVVALLRIAPASSSRRVRMGAAAAAVATVVTVLAMPGGQTLWARLHAAAPEQVIHAEDGSGLSLLRSEEPGFSGTVTVFVNGLSQSLIPYGGVHTALGILPVLLHPAPSDVALIGLGSGDTVFSAAARTDIVSLVCIEIVESQLVTLDELTQHRQYAGLQRLLADQRIEHRVGDGRAYLQQGTRRFDILEADALRPSSAYSGNLYSREYFDLLRRNLKTGGFAVTWSPTQRVRDTFLSVFPHAIQFEDVLIGSSEPIVFDQALMLARATAVRDYFAASGIDIEALVRQYLAAPQTYSPDYVRRNTSDLNTDLFPRDEFELMRTGCC